MSEEKITTRSAEETRRAAEEFIRALSKQPAVARAWLVCLWGDLGSGKTTFAQGVARALGVAETVNSPTFLIMKKYPLGAPRAGKDLYHFDLYRLAGSQELLELGWEEILAAAGSVVLVEWPEKICGILPKERFDLRFSAGPRPDERQIVIEKKI